MNPHNLLCLLLLLFWSCEVTEPERAFNDKPGRPRYAMTHAVGIDTVRYYAGVIDVEFTIDSVDFPLRQVECYLDGYGLTSWTSSPYRVTIDTRAYSQGAHSLRLALYGDGEGIPSLHGGPPLLRLYPIHFDQTPPDTVSLLSLEWNGNHPALTWRRSRNRNFSSYIVENRTSSYQTFRDTITAIDDTTFTDTSLTKAIGIASAVYSVAVSNHVSSVSGSIRSIGFGEEIPISHNSYVGRRRYIIPSRLRPEVYYYNESNSTFSVFSTVTHATLYSLTIPNVQNMCLRDNEDSLFILTMSAYSLYKFSPQTRTLDSITNSRGAFLSASLALGRPNRAYFAGYGFQTAQLSPWTQLSYSFHEGHYLPRLMQIAPDHENLYYLADSYNMLYRLDIRPDTPQVVAQHPASGYPSGSVGLALSSNTNEILFGTNNVVEVMDAGTLQLKRTLQFSEGSNYSTFIGHLEVTDAYVYVAYIAMRQYPGAGAPTFGKIVQLRKSDWGIQRSWRFCPAAQAFIVLPGDSQIYASTSDGRGWVITIE
jgi:hypothetical protein